MNNMMNLAIIIMLLVILGLLISGAEWRFCRTN